MRDRLLVTLWPEFGHAAVSSRILRIIRTRSSLVTAIWPCNGPQPVTGRAEAGQLWPDSDHLLARELGASHEELLGLCDPRVGRAVWAEVGAPACIRTAHRS